MKPTFEILTGRTDAHIETLSDGKTRLHKKVLKDFRKLCEQAEQEGFPLKVVSSFRDYSTQLRIWNEKAEGKRPLLDAEGNPLEFSKLKPDDIVTAILRWSALPGASRHHWGTDFDVVCASAIPEGYEIQLTPAEAARGGVFREFAVWLEDTLPVAEFYRPYEEDRGGVAPEWWHLSYAPLAETYRDEFSPEILKRSIEESDLRLKDVVLRRLDDIYETYIDNVRSPEEA